MRRTSPPTIEDKDAVIAQIRLLEQRRVLLFKELATLDARVRALLNVSEVTRKPASQMLSASECARHMRRSKRTQP